MKASIHSERNRDGSEVWKVRWRQKVDGVLRQKSLSLGSAVAAERFRINVEKFGPERAFEMAGIENGTGAPAETLAQACEHHIDHLTGIEEGTRLRYRRYMENDLYEIGTLPLTTVSETVVASWILWLQDERNNSGKTVANKHGFLSAALDRARRDGKITTNPCEHTRLPAKDRTREPVFLTRAQFEAFRGAMPAEWHALTTWLVATGMRFSEATALNVANIDPDTATCRVTQAWKYTGTATPKLGAPKSRAGRRTINLPPEALAVVDLTRPGLAFTTPAGNRVAYPRFYESAWEKGIKATGIDAGPHDLRHTCASWMIAAGVPLPVIQAHLGHESITTTIGVYGHLDRTSHRQAADAISRAMSPAPTAPDAAG